MPRVPLTVDTSCSSCRGTGIQLLYYDRAEERRPHPCHCVRPAAPRQEPATPAARTQPSPPQRPPDERLRRLLERERQRVRELEAEVARLRRTDPRIARALIAFDEWRRLPEELRRPAAVFLEELVHGLAGPPPQV